MFLNLCFHKIVSSESEITNKYWLTLDKFILIKDTVENFVKNNSGIISNIRYYFDDGDDSLRNFIYDKVNFESSREIIGAIPTDFIGQNGKLTRDDIKYLYKNGIKFAPHGVSHAALAIYKDNMLQDTPQGGVYQNSPYGKTKALSENEVLYQLNESKKIMTSILGDVEEFVLPYCLYNETTIEINKKHGIYKIITNCDDAYDIGQPIRPRFLIDNEQNIDNLLDSLNKTIR